MKNMVTIDESTSLFIVSENVNGYKIVGYMPDDDDYGDGLKKWLNTLVDQNGKRIVKRNPMENKSTYNELNDLTIKVIAKYKEQNKI